MARTKLKVDKNKYSNSLIRKSEIFMSDFTFEQFFNVFDEFITLKTLEGLALRSIHDYQTNTRYFKEYLEQQQRTSLIRCLDIDVLGDIFSICTKKRNSNHAQLTLGLEL